MLGAEQKSGSKEGGGGSRAVNGSMTWRWGLPSKAFSCSNLGDAVQGSLREGRHGSLHADLDSFERAKSNIGEELGGGGGGEVKPGLVLVRCLLTGKVRVLLLEVFVEAVLECSLGLTPRQPIAPELGCPAGLTE